MYKGYKIVKLRSGWFSIPALKAKYATLKQAKKNVDRIIPGAGFDIDSL